MAENQIRGTESQDCPSIRVRITGGGDTPEAPLSDVNFYDYDGKRVASYTAADFAALDAMPANPSHQGLTAQGWNWSLSDAKAYVAKYGRLIIGQQYITDDGKTRLYINIATKGRMSPSIYWTQTAANGVIINWGDGSAEETVAGTGDKSLSHTYALPGEYVIILEVSDGNAELGNSNNISVLGDNSNANKIYLNMLKKAEIGDNIEMLASSFRESGIRQITITQGMELPSNTFNLTKLEYITIHEGSTTIGTGTFNSNDKIKAVSLPNGIISVGSSCFALLSPEESPTLPDTMTGIANSCFNGLTSSSLTIPDGITSIGTSSFINCVNLAILTIPASVTTISATAFSSCYGMAEYHFKGTTPPTITANTFNNIPADCKIYVPASAVATYQGATNWSTYASQIVGE